MDTAFVTGLDRVDPADLAAAGGKAANLAALIGAGFRVPGGFCLGTAAYARAVAATGPGGGAATDRPHGPAAGAALRAGPVPEEIAREVRAAYAALGADVPVAVRSSATAEDLPTASFAGQQDTYLNVVGPDAVLDAVRRCWASLWTDRAVAYRATAGVDPRTVRLAVVVQRMVEAEIAGVLFTADPVTGRRGRIVIDAAPGLGEAVVSGAVNPDRVVVEPDGTVAEYRVGDKATAVRAVPGGGVERVTRTAGRAGGGRCLSAARIAELAALGRRVEAHFGAPQDLEWAVDTAGTPWLLQARPITTLHPLPAPAGPGPRAYLCVSLAQGLTRPVTPMGVSAFRVIAARAAREAFRSPVADPLAGPAALTTAGGRVFVDVTPVLHSPGASRLAPAVLDVMEARSAVVLRALAGRPGFAPRGRSPLPFAAGVLRTVLHFRVPLLLARSLLRPGSGVARAHRIGRRVRALRPLGPGATARERLDHAVRLLDGVFPVLPGVVPVAGAGFAALGAARLLAGPALDAAAVHEVLRSLPHNSTTGMDLRLWAVAVRVRSDPESVAALDRVPAAELSARYRRRELPAVLAAELDAFLAAHGHRAVAEIDLGMPRWSDDPSHLLGVLANYLRVAADDAPDARFARGARAAEQAVAQVVARVRERSAWRARLTGLALDRVRELAGMREEHKDMLVRVLAVARAELAAVGAELAGRGRLDAPEDVFFVELAELGAALDGNDHRDLVRARRAEYDRELGRRHVPRVLLSDGTEPEAEPGAGPVAADGALTGSPASAGTATAPARVVLDPVGARIEPGEVLVCPSTDPGWTPLFLTAGALVMEMGGSNSHGAVVAREYGIPAVVGVAGATGRIADGDLLTVDGGAGLVRIEPPG